MSRSFSRQQLALTPLDLSQVTLQEAVNRVLQFPAVASKQFLITIGDRSITGLVATQPMIGPWQVPVADAAVMVVATGVKVTAQAVGAVADAVIPDSDGD